MTPYRSEDLISATEATKRAVLKVDPDKKNLSNLTKKDLVKAVEAYDYIIKECDGIFTMNQECMLMDMRKSLIHEIELREVE